MEDLIKSGEVSSRYGVSTRTLRYYEEAGLLQSRRTADYAYRMYDGGGIKRLEQILILRRLNVGVKDIRRIFESSSTEVVLEVLSKKVTDIDGEIALLNELKEIIASFIRQIEESDFSKDGDVTRLYDKAREIKTQLGEYGGNPSPATRLLDITDKLAERAASRLSFPDNVLKRLLRNVYFIWGSNDGIAVADELGRRYGIYVYHTCDYRQTHTGHADPRFQPGLSRNVPDFFAQEPLAAMEWERETVRDFTPMVIMDLIQLTATHGRVICENDIDVESIISIATHAVQISNANDADKFYTRYENEIRGRDIPDREKNKLLRQIQELRGKDKYDAARYGVKEIIIGENNTGERAIDLAAEYFNF
jgi:DNA-binding transcriptional MerR regulator